MSGTVHALVELICVHIIATPICAFCLPTERKHGQAARFSLRTRDVVHIENRAKPVGATVAGICLAYFATLAYHIGTLWIHSYRIHFCPTI